MWNWRPWGTFQLMMISDTTLLRSLSSLVPDSGPHIFLPPIGTLISTSFSLLCLSLLGALKSRIQMGWWLCGCNLCGCDFFGLEWNYRCLCSLEDQTCMKLSRVELSSSLKDSPQSFIFYWCEVLNIYFGGVLQWVWNLRIFCSNGFRKKGQTPKYSMYSELLFHNGYYFEIHFSFLKLFEKTYCMN